MVGVSELKRKRADRSAPGRTGGFTLIELMITLVVLSIGLLGLAGLQVGVVRANAFNRDMMIANSIGTDLLEEAKAEGDSLSDVNETFVYDMDVDGDGDDDDPYNGRFSVTRQVTKFTHFAVVDVGVSWVDSLGESHRLTFKTDIAQ